MRIVSIEKETILNFSWNESKYGGFCMEWIYHFVRNANKIMIFYDVISQVVDACKEHIPSLAASFDDPRLTLHIGDGMEFLKQCKQQFDVIITDASDPVVADADFQSKDGLLFFL